MQFSYSIPWWAWVLLLAGVALLAHGTYARLVVPLTTARRATLTALRAATLLLVLVCLLRPFVLLPPQASGHVIVPVLVDVSRSMGLSDEEGERRLDQASDIVRRLQAQLTGQFNVELLMFGETLAPAPAGPLAADARRSDLAGALKALRERFRGRAVAGVVVVSDGGETGGQDAAASIEPGGPAIFPIGVGPSSVHHDREILGLTAGDAALAESIVDLNVSAVSHGFGVTPIELRVLANGRPIDGRRVTPVADGSPIHEVFTVSPNRDAATLYTVEIPPERGDIAPENNARSVLVSPPGRTRRLLLIEGAPGFEHSFLKRAWAQDPGIEVDSVVRKGKNERGADTFFVQADRSRTAALATGYPVAREALFAYDAVIFANVEGDFFSRGQLALTADFVAERGGGLLVLGARSFAQQSLVNTPLEEVLPVELSDRRGGVMLTSQSANDEQGNRLVVTPEGEVHPIMRIARSLDESRRRWAALPPLASTAALGGPRPGAQVLAVAGANDRVMHPVVAVQRYGKGRSMIFAGEASWRWRMMMPSTDRTHEIFWRQAGRWLSTPAPDPVSLTVPASAAPGETVPLDLTVRDGAFVPIPDATTSIRLTLPGGETRELTPSMADASSGRFTAPLHLDHPGVYRASAEAHRGDVSLGSSDQWFLVGGADEELADPRLNDDVLRRIAGATGGRYVQAREVDALPRLLQSVQAEAGQPERRELWHNPFAFLIMIALLSSEWILRRRWGLR